MISAILLIVFIWQFYIGYARGIVLQTYYLVASVLSLVIAGQFYQPLADKLTLWLPYANAVQGATMAFWRDMPLFDLDQVYYAGAAFTAIYSLAYLAFRLLGVFVHLAPVNRWDNVGANVVSGVFSVLVTMMFFSLVLTLLATVPLSLVQNTLSGSGLVRFLVDSFYPFVNSIKDLWAGFVLN